MAGSPGGGRPSEDAGALEPGILLASPEPKYAAGDKVWGIRETLEEGGKRGTVIAPTGHVDRLVGRVYLISWDDGLQGQFPEAWMKPWTPELEAKYRAEEADERRRFKALQTFYEAQRQGLVTSDQGGVEHGLRGNKAIEDAAIDFVKQYELRAGREPSDTRYKGAPADLESSGRVIEVKAAARSVRTSGFLFLETRQVEEARRNPEFYVYIVENVVQGDPAAFELRILGSDRLRKLVERAKERRYYEVPLPTREYDAMAREKTTT